MFDNERIRVTKNRARMYLLMIFTVIVGGICAFCVFTGKIPPQDIVESPEELRQLREIMPGSGISDEAFLGFVMIIGTAATVIFEWVGYVTINIIRACILKTEIRA